LRVFRNTLLGIAVLALLAVSAWLYLNAREPVPEESSYVFDIEEVRRLADELPGEKARAINAELVAEAELPRAGVFAGAGFEAHLMVHQVFQVVFPDGFLLIDAAFDESVHEQMGGLRPFYPEAKRRVQEALQNADQVLITHEHLDHIQGLALSADPASLAKRLRLSREQFANQRRLDEAEIPEALRNQSRILDYESALAVAPGVVVVKAAGHTPGSQLIYVQLADGREFLFLGDVAWHMDAIRQLHYRPRLVTDLILGEDRAAVLDQFRTLHDLMEAEPGVVLVSSHDADQRRSLVRRGTFGSELSR